MRATYEGLLTVAHRQALEAFGRVSTDPLEVAAGWSAVLSATRRQLEWLSWELETRDVALETGSREGDAPLKALARSLGAAADLLASQDVVTATAFDHHGGVAAARRAVATIVSVAAGAALRALEPADAGPSPLQVLISDHLRTAQSELQEIASLSTTLKLGALGSLATSMPVASTERFAAVAYLAAQWQRNHEQVPPGSLLTRDLRSISAQVRTATGHSRFLIDALGSSAQRLGLNGPMLADLRAVSGILRLADQGAVRASAAWQRHVSDLGGQTSLPGEFTFAELHSLLRDAVSRDGRVIPASELIPSQATAKAILGAVDEILHSAHEVSRGQRDAVVGLISSGRLFVPHRAFARADPSYVRPPGPRTGRLQGTWVWTTQQDRFTELTGALNRVAYCLAKASEGCRRLAGTVQQGRPSAMAVPARPRDVTSSVSRQPVMVKGFDRSRDFPGVELL